MDNASADDAAPFGSTPGRLWLLKVPSALADAWSKAPPGTDLGSVEARDGGGLRLRPSSGPTKAYDLSKTTGAETRAFQAVAHPAPTSSRGSFVGTLVRHIPWRRVAAAATWIFRGVESQRRRGCDVDPSVEIDAGGAT